ncbi:MAG: hypothetical protein AB9869_18155 [Verrucomicrobiia bacterium]
MVITTVRAIPIRMSTARWDGGTGSRAELSWPWTVTLSSSRYDTWKREAKITTKNRMFCNPGTANGR